jgi:DNA-binding response OmpR family regulator
VATAGDGREALDLLASIRPELILLDLGMPIMDGAHFRQEQRRNAEWIRIPTIVMTGGHDEPQLDLAVEQTLRKPVHVQELLAIVRSHCTSRFH